ncbi:MAG: AI-2E family transporter [Oscillospiraceae bacterium]|nr:AI-2E family transporter [Oscillospiraceae bacterium]
MKKSNPELQAQIRKCICYGVTALLVIACALILYFCIERISGLRSFVGTVTAALMPIVWGVVIAYLLSPSYNFLHRHLYPALGKRCSEKTARGWAKGLSIFLSLLLLVLILYALIAMMVPRLIDSIVRFVNSIPTYIQQMRGALNVLLADYPEVHAAVLGAFNSATSYAQNWINTHLDFESITNDSLQELLANAWDMIYSISAGVKNIVVFLKNFIIGIIVAVYVLASKQHMCGQGKKLIYTIFPRKAANIILENCRFAHHAMSGFISGKLLDSVIIGVLCFIGCSVLSIPYALLVSVIIGVTNVVPFFGPFIGAIPSALFILLVDPVKCLAFVIFILILQQFDGNILGPKILGDYTGLNSFWAIFALLLFGGLFGVPGMILGCPVFAVMYHILDEVSQALLHRKGMSTDTGDYELLGSVENGTYQKVPDPAYESDPFAQKKRSERRSGWWSNMLNFFHKRSGAPEMEDSPSEGDDDSSE